MFRQLLKPIWKRKSRNLMLSLEIALAFVVVFAIAAAASRYYQLYHLPTGFNYEDVWSVQMELPNDDDAMKNDAQMYDKFKRSLQALPEVEQVAFANSSPYEDSTWRTGYYLPEGGADADSDLMTVSDDFFAVMGMTLTEGRWFSSADEGAAEEPVVVNRRFVQALFPGQNPLGKIISDGKPDSKDRKMLRITGVIDDLRNHGEFMLPTNFVIARFSPQSSTRGVATILLKVKPGTERIFEATLSNQLKLVRNDWSYRISPLSDLRESHLRRWMMPLIVFSVIAAFLLLMVAFGLFGVLWQNTTQRIPELGLRRAIGATAGNIYRQIIVEQLLLSTLAMLVGLVLLVQLPITGVLGENLDWRLFSIATLISVTIMALVSVLCALYPAWQASRLSPTEALHYE
ncbi:MAG TPA: FtsX-like permease family protein [Arenimonas sp.]|uniref:ABC transporter permease n=1 Tax=Arenimonas sp. TaxID=1872635 RepID=UPI002C1F4FD6|nr:FtsX-like permease family protein [Arenimonas sp.]HMB58005.1 FtsX-like permease family protein [Arenimonas sp.]